MTLSNMTIVTILGSILLAMNVKA